MVQDQVRRNAGEFPFQPETKLMSQVFTFPSSPFASAGSGSYVKHYDIQGDSGEVGP